MELRPLGKIPDSNRILYAAFPSSMNDLLQATSYPSKYFGLLFSWPVEPLMPKEVFKVAKHFVEAGAVYVSTWGKDCERVHDIFDDAILDALPDAAKDRRILTTWLEGKFLRGALWDFIHVAFPNTGYEKECEAAVMIFWNHAEKEVLDLIRKKKMLKQKGPLPPNRR